MNEQHEQEQEKKQAKPKEAILYRYVGKGNRDGIPARNLTEADLAPAGRAYIEGTVCPNTGEPMYEKV